MTTPALEARLRIEVGREGAGFAVEAELLLERGVLVLFGPSGAGKSLTLQALAGLLRPARGVIRVGGKTLYDGERRLDVPAHRRGLGYVPQHQSLFPFLSVAENVAFGLPRAERRRANPRVRELLAELGLSALASARPASLSGGERQRVALARALAVRPSLLLLDEPFAALDMESRIELRGVLRAALELQGTPAVFVTHDPDEALALGDSLVRFELGRTIAAGDPATLLDRSAEVTVRGEPAGAACPAGEGRVEVELRGATLTGPAELLRPGEDGRIALDLRARSQGAPPLTPRLDPPAHPGAGSRPRPRGT